MRTPTLVIIVLCTAFAARAADDTVLLQNGGRVRGVIMEESPDAGVSIRLADGTVKKIAAADIKHVDHGDDAAPAAPATTGPKVVVQLETDNPKAVLERVNATFEAHGDYTSIAGSDTSVVCRAPCGLALDTNISYRIAGEGVTPSAPFLLPKDGDTATIRVKAGDVNGNTLGLLLGSAGAAVGLIGGVFLGVGLAVQDHTDGFVATGAAGFAVGTLVAVPSYIWMAMSETDVATTSGGKVAAR